MSLKKMSVRGLVWVFAVFSAIVSVRAADEMKPVALLSIAGYDAQIGAVDTLADLLGQKETLDAMLMMLGETEGFDKSRPAGALVLSDSQKLFAFGFLPIDDLDALECPGVEAFRENYDSDTGLLTISGDGDDAVDVQLTVRDGWCFVTAPGKESLLPEQDPLKLLDELDQDALIAGKLYADRVPAELLDSLLAPIRQQMADIDPSQSGSFENGIKMVVSLLESLETVSFALTVDSVSGDTVLTVDSQVKPDTQMAAIYDKMKNAESLWSDFFQPDDSVFAMREVDFQTEEMISLVRENYKSTFKELAEALESDMDDEEQSERMKKVLDDFTSFVDASVGLSQLDAACSLTNDHLFLLGGTIGGGDRLIAALDGLKEDFAAGGEGEFSELFDKVRINESNYAGYKISTVTLSDDIAEQMAGIDPDLAGLTGAALLGVKDDALILIAGLDKKKVSEKFKALADAPRKPKPAGATVFEFSLKNVGVFLGNLLPNAEGTTATIITTLKDGSADAVITADNQIDQRKATARFIIRGEFFKLIGQAIEQVQTTDVESESDTDDDLFDSTTESL